MGCICTCGKWGAYVRVCTCTCVEGDMLKKAQNWPEMIFFHSGGKRLKCHKLFTSQLSLIREIDIHLCLGGG